MAHYDVVFVWISVHGGSWHKLLTLHELLREQGVRSKVLINASHPLGLQEGVDFTPRDVEQLAELDAHILSMEGMAREIGSTPARLYVFDPHRYENGEEILNEVRNSHGALTAQLGTLIGDYTYKGADHVFIQNLLALWFMMDHTSGRRRARSQLSRAHSIHFCGNIFYEAVDNTWTTTVRNKQDLCEKYNIDSNKPICLLLPDRVDSKDPAVMEMASIIRKSGMNLMVKLHPWEYKQQVHGYEVDPGEPSPAEKWGVHPLEERDASWGLRYCDQVICRGSAVGLEVPYHEKPVAWVWPQADYRTLITRSCSLHLRSPEDLSGLVRNTDLPSGYAKSDYTDAISRISAVESGQSFAYHAQGIVDILEGRTPSIPMGEIDPLRRLYLGRVPWGYLRGEHKIEHGLARILRPFRSAPMPDYLFTTEQGLRF